MNRTVPRRSAVGGEDARLEALKSYEVMDTPPEQDLDRLVDLAVRVLDVPIALITLLDSERQFFKANVGMEGAETPRSISFCTVALEQDGVFVVPDAAKDPRFCTSPLVTGPSAVRFY